MKPFNTNFKYHSMKLTSGILVAHQQIVKSTIEEREKVAVTERPSQLTQKTDVEEKSNS